MTATQDRQEGLEAVSDEIPWRDRSAFGSLRGVPWWGAVLIALCVSIAGAVADSRPTSTPTHEGSRP